MTSPAVHPAYAPLGRAVRRLPLDSDRRAFLGASEIAAVLGLSKYATPLVVHLRKRGEVPEFEGSAFTEWGTRLEDAVRRAYVEKIAAPGGLDVVPGSVVGRIQHPSIDWQVCSPDGMVHLASANGENPASWLYGLECKTADRAVAHLWGEDGTDQVPDAYALQCHYAMHVTGLDRWDVAVLIGGNDFRTYTLRRDQELLDTFLPELGVFWLGVEAGIRPEPMAADNALIGKMLRQAREDLLENDPDVNDLAVALVQARADLAVAQEQADEIEARIKARIGERAGAVGPWGKISWKQNREGQATDWKAVAKEAGATAELIAAHTTIKAGSRPFRFTAAQGGAA
jgi:putative phage-type endonuclease